MTRTIDSIFDLEKVFSTALADYVIAHLAPSAETSTELGVSVHRYAKAAGVPPDAAMYVVRGTAWERFAEELSADPNA